jgi:hypothetical protein
MEQLASSNLGLAITGVQSQLHYMWKKWVCGRKKKRTTNFNFVFTILALDVNYLC